MYNKIYIILTFSLCTLKFNNHCTAQEVKKLVFENMNNEVQDKLENGGWGEWRDDYFNFAINIFTILDFENKQMITTLFSANDNSIFSDTMEMKNLSLDISKSPIITAKFKTSHQVSKTEYNHLYTFIGCIKQGDYDYFLYDEVSYLSNNKLKTLRTKTYLRWKENE